MIISTSGFSANARAEAVRQDAQPIELIDGAGLVALLVETQLGARRDAHDVLDLAAELPGEIDNGG